MVAKSLRLGSTRTIGLVVPDIANPFFAAIARAASAAAHARGYSVLLGDAGDDVAHEIELLAGLLTRQPDGLVVIPVGQQCDHLKQLRACGPCSTLCPRRSCPTVPWPRSGPRDPAAVIRGYGWGVIAMIVISLVAGP